MPSPPLASPLASSCEHRLPPDTRWECNGQTNQGWRVEPVHKYIHSQLSPEGNFCLDRREDYSLILSWCSEVQHHLISENDMIEVGGSEYAVRVC